jgi:glutathione-independent formaldehyde dehydrogenase
VIGLDQTRNGYAAFDSGVPKKFGIDPYGSLQAA